MSKGPNKRKSRVDNHYHSIFSNLLCSSGCSSHPQEKQTVQDVDTTTPKEFAQHLDNDVIIAVALGTTQLCARKLGLTGITTTLADPLQEDPVAEATAGHPIEADPTGVLVEALTATSIGHPSTTAGKGEALHHMYIRLVILHTFFQDHMQQKDN